MTSEFLKICFKSLKNIHRHAPMCKVLNKSLEISVLMKGYLLVLSVMCSCFYSAVGCQCWLKLSYCSMH